jgi:hypothetical protein
MRRGWFRDGYRHSLAARGISTKRRFEAAASIPGEYEGEDVSSPKIIYVSPRIEPLVKPEIKSSEIKSFGPNDITPEIILGRDLTPKEKIDFLQGRINDLQDAISRTYQEDEAIRGSAIEQDIENNTLKNIIAEQSTKISLLEEKLANVERQIAGIRIVKIEQPEANIVKPLTTEEMKRRLDNEVEAFKAVFGKRK